jgi:hypothetical protein
MHVEHELKGSQMRKPERYAASVVPDSLSFLLLTLPVPSSKLERLSRTYSEALHYVYSC